MTKNKILTAINGFLGVQFFGMVNEDGSPKLTTVLEGTPLGTTDESSSGEVGAKVIVIADRSNNGNGTIVSPPSCTPHPASMSASGSVVFPVGATQIAFALLTGTGTVGGVAWPIGFPYNNTGPLTSTLTVTTGSTSTAITDYSTTP